MTAVADAYFDRLLDDLPFFAREQLFIKTKAAALVPFVLNRAQQFIHEKIEDQLRRKGKVRLVILKGRQQGSSTLIEGRAYWKATTRKGINVRVIAHDADTTRKLFAMTRRFYDMAPMKPSIRFNSATAMEFANLQSEFAVSTAGSPHAGRGTTAQIAHCSEVAFWDGATEIMEGLGQVIPNAPGTEIILESTANGVGNYFHQRVMDALEGKGEYELAFVPWMWQEEYAVTPPEGWRIPAKEAEYAALYALTPAQAYWRHLKIVDDFGGNESSFDQEYPATVALAFRKVSGDVFIPMEPVEAAMKGLSIPTIGPKILGLDPAEYGPDSSVFIGRQGRNARLFYKRFHGIGQMALAGHAARIMDAGKFDSINIDVTGGYGGGVADRLIEQGYNVNRVNFGETAIEEDKYPRRMDEMWGAMKDWLVNGPVLIPNDPVLQMELTGRQFRYDSARRTVLESKEHMRARGLKSPDGADALALTFAMPARAKKPKPNVTPFQGGTIGY